MIRLGFPCRSLPEAAPARVPWHPCDREPAQADT